VSQQMQIMFLITSWLQLNVSLLSQYIWLWLWLWAVDLQGRNDLLVKHTLQTTCTPMTESPVTESPIKESVLGL